MGKIVFSHLDRHKSDFTSTLTLLKWVLNDEQRDEVADTDNPSASMSNRKTKKLCSAVIFSIKFWYKTRGIRHEDKLSGFVHR